MTKKLMKNLMLMLVISVLCFAVGVTASAEDRIVVDSGECGAEGDNVIWTFYDDGELVISGNGKIKDYATVSYIGLPEWSHYDIVKVTIEEGVTGIGAASFRCNDMVSIDIPQSVVSIGFDAFSECKYLETVIIPEGVPDIEKNTFYNCRSLTSVVIPDSVTNIGEWAFFDCRSLTSVNIPDSVINIGDRAFTYCYSLKSITVDINNPAYSNDEYGVLFNKDKSVLVQYPAGLKITEYVVPTTVQTLGGCSFEGNFYLEKIILPDGLLTISNCAFWGCVALKELNMPNSLITIGSNAIMYCVGLTELTIPENVEKIDICAILCCYYMDDIYVRSMTSELDLLSMNYTDHVFEGLEQDKCKELIAKMLLEDKEASVEYEKYVSYNTLHLSDIHCHAGSTAEAYAIENDVDYVLTHFFTDDWTYDYDKMIRSRKCIHCDELEIEQLEISTDEDVEIVAPMNPDTDFEVEEIEKNSDNFLVVEESLSQNIEGSFDILKAFDINIKNSDGVHVQPDGSVKVKLPLDWEKDGNYKVYRVNDDGTLTDMNAYRQGSHMVFDTDHFSIYVIVEENVEEETPSTEKFSFSEFLKNIFNWFKEIIEKITDIFRSIGDLT